jgi:hypothetical protein
MRIARIDFEGNNHYATITRQPGGEFVEATIVYPDQPRRIHQVQADCQEDLWSMAECLQFHLDGCRGTNSMINEFYEELRRFAD